MEALVQELQSNQIPTKVKALEDLIIKLDNTKFLNNASSDVRMRLFSTTITLIKDANPKVVLLSLDCLDKFLEKYSEFFQPLTNLTFDYIITKLGDAKLQIRTRTITSFISLVNYVGLVAGYQKLNPLFVNKNSRLREQVLSIMLLLHEIYGEEIATLPDILSKVYPLLKDPVESIRQLAIQVCGCLYATIGESLVLELKNADFKSDALFESIRQAALRSNGASNSAQIESNDNDDGDCDGDGDVEEIQVDRLPAQLQTPNQSTNDHPRLSASGPTSPLEIPKSKSSNNLSSTTGSARPKSYDGRSIQKSPVVTNSSPSPQTNWEGESMPLKRGVSASNSVGTDSSEGTTASINKYLPSVYFTILGDGLCCQPIFISSEREFNQHMTSIVTNLQNKDDWQARLNGLYKFQSILKGIHESTIEDEEYLPSDAVTELLIGFVRSSLQEMIGTQISDLRSAISKEACRTVAMMARVMRGNISPLLESWVPLLLKLLSVKIQVILSAADRCLRAIIVCGSPNGFSKVLQIFLEMLSSKSSIIRKYCFEYITLGAISWESDFAFERNSVALKKAIQAGVSDADSQARKTARVLYWLLRQRSSWNRPLQLMLDIFDNTARKHVENEQYQSEFLEISRNRALLSSIEVYDLDWKEVEAPQISRNGSLSSSGRVSVGSDIQSLKSEDEEDLGHKSDRPITTNKGGISATFENDDGMLENEVGNNGNPGNLREQTMLLKTKKHFSASAGNLGKSSRVGGGSQRLSMAPQKTPLPAEDLGNNGNSGSSGTALGTLPARAPLSGSLMAKRLTKSASVRSDVPLDSDLKDKEATGSGSGLTIGPQRVVVAQRTESSKPTNPTNERPALRAQRTPVVHNATESSNSETIRSTSKIEREKVSEQVQSSISLPSFTETKALISDPLWSNRILGLQAANNRFIKWISTSTSDSTHPQQLEELLDLVIKCLNDSHQRVSTDANIALMTLTATQNSLLCSRLGILLPILFNRLNDRKPLTRSQSTELLDSIRAVHDPCTLIGILSPRITDVPERTLISIIQFLITIAPLCSSYFCQSQNTGAFLNRMAIILSSNRRPSPTLVQSGQRLLELVYKASTEVVLSQISTLPLQHQTELKRVLLGRIPNIDILVTSASKMDSQTMRTSAYESSDEPLEILRSSPVDLNIITGTDSVDCETDGYETLNQQPSPLVIRSQFLSPIDKTEYNPAMYSPGSQPHPTLPLAHSQSQLLSPSPIIDHPLPPTPPLLAPPVPPPPTSSSSSSSFSRMMSPNSSNRKENTQPVESPGQKGAKDIVWLLQTLRYDGGANRDDKKRAIVELKRLAKSASEEYWKRNCAQIVSVLLEAFTPPTRGLYDPLLPLSPHLKPTSNNYLPTPPLTGLSPLHLYDREQKVDMTNNDYDLEEEILYNQRMESMHIASKGLLILIKVLGKNHLQGFLELIVCRLCQAVSYAPVAISLHFQEILNLISSFDSTRLITLLLPYISKDSSSATSSSSHSGLVDDQDGHDSIQATRLLALQSLSSAVSHLTSPQLLELLPSITEVVLPHFTSSLVDIRKGVVFILVEIYMIIGDSLYPYVKGLAPSQRKLLTVYIERQLNRNSGAHSSSMPYDM